MTGLVFAGGAGVVSCLLVCASAALLSTAVTARASHERRQLFVLFIKSALPQKSKYNGSEFRAEAQEIFTRRIRERADGRPHWIGLLQTRQRVVLVGEVTDVQRHVVTFLRTAPADAGVIDTRLDGAHQRTFVGDVVEVIAVIVP